MLELKIQEFKDKITQEQREELYSRTFSIKEKPGLVKKIKQVPAKKHDRYVFRDWKQIMNQT